MSSCRVCGTEKFVSFRAKKGFQYLCDSCSKDTPKKVSLGSFCKEYFNTEPENIKRSILNEFYDDYRTSTLTLQEYCQQTTENFY